MRVRYRGPFIDGVEVHMPDGPPQYVPHGGYLECDDETGARLLEQEANWAPSDQEARDTKADLEEQAEKDDQAQVKAQTKEAKVQAKAREN